MNEPGQVGGGKYDADCEELLKKFEALGVALIVLDGKKGNGFSVSMPNDKVLIAAMAWALKEAAEDLRRRSL